MVEICVISVPYVVYSSHFAASLFRWEIWGIDLGHKLHRLTPVHSLDAGSAHLLDKATHRFPQGGNSEQQRLVCM